MLGAILYRHWLELRFRVLAAIGPWVVLCAASALAAVLLSSRVPATVVYAWALSIAVLVAGLVFGGTGIRLGLETGHRNFTLTLPVSRIVLASTRLGVAAVISMVIVLGLLSAVVVALWSAGQAIPLASMAASTFLGLIVAVGIQSQAGLVLPLITERFSPAILSMTAAGAIVSIGRALDERSTGWFHVVRFLTFEPARWDLVALLLVAIASSLAVAAVLLRVKDY